MVSIQSTHRSFVGIVGEIDAIVDQPETFDRVAIVCHPNPLFKGTNQNKVTATIARTLNQLGFCTVRPNFRGVGNSAGEHGRGVDETEDILHLIPQVIEAYPTDQPLTLSGFSFGAFVITRVIQQLQAQSFPLGPVILTGLPVSLFDCLSVEHERVLFVHGQKDEVIPLDEVLDWLAAQNHYVAVVPGVDHFFSGKLHILKRAIANFICPTASCDDLEE